MQGMVPLCGFGGVPYSAVRKAAPRNLLDNSDFRNPVNQRGVFSGTLTDWNYFIDRWRCIGDCTYELTDGGIHITGGAIAQTLAEGTKDNGKTYTFAVCLSTGTIRILTYTIPETDVSEWTIFNNKEYSDVMLEVGGASSICHVMIHKISDCTIRWAALYEGEYTAETLPEYQPKGYGAELAECQRYYLHGVGKHCPGLILADGSIKVFVPTTVTMRTTPTATAILLDNAVYNNGADRVIALKSIASIELKPTGVYVVFNTDLEAGQDMFHTLMTFGTTLHLSADL